MPQAVTRERVVEALVALQRTLNEHEPDLDFASRNCREAGFEILSQGRHRIVVNVSDRAVAKLAWQPTGTADNLIEARLWRRCDETLRRRLCPVLGLLPECVLVQRRCQPIPLEQADPGVGAFLASCGISDSRVNLGVLEGRTVIYDYALVAPRLARALLRGVGEHEFDGVRFEVDPHDSSSRPNAACSSDGVRAGNEA